MLVDELASGTDPVEGSALAQALLDRLARQARLTVATTHYPELKEWASSTEGAVNAATGFDPETNAPLYRLALGRPGTSHALRIAERLGIDARGRRGRAGPGRARAPARRRAAGRGGGGRAARGRCALGGRAGAEPRAARPGRRRRARGTSCAAEIESVRASAAQERERAVERGGRRAGRGARRARRAPRRDPRGAQARGRAPACSVPCRRECRAGARPPARSCLRARRAGRAGACARCEPVVVTAPLAAGDPVEAPRARGPRDDRCHRGRRGRGRRPRRPAHPRSGRAAPARRCTATGRTATEPAVRVVAAARGDVSDELDVRGRRAQEAREAVRAFVDDGRAGRTTAGAGRPRSRHGRGARGRA